jgi:hypothetical protein
VLKDLDASALLLHVRLRGRFIYQVDNPDIDVDGEAFGLVEGAELHEVLPSGDAHRGGDLELWFHLRPGD